MSNKNKYPDPIYKRGDKVYSIVMKKNAVIRNINSKSVFCYTIDLGDHLIVATREQVLPQKSIS